MFIDLTPEQRQLQAELRQYFSNLISSDEMKAVAKFLRQNHLYTMTPNNSIHTNPPLCITEEQLAEGFDVIDRALAIADEAVTG